MLVTNEAGAREADSGEAGANEAGAREVVSVKLVPEKLVPMKHVLGFVVQNDEPNNNYVSVLKLKLPGVTCKP